MNEILKTIQSRRSIRSFKAEVPSKELINQVIEAGRWAASGKNRQSSIIIAVTNKEIINRLSKCNGEIAGRSNDQFYGAPVVLVVLSDKNNSNKMYDGALILGNMMLAAQSLSLGSCWINRAKQEFEMKEWQDWLSSLCIEGEWEGVGHLALGFPDEEPADLPRTGNTVFWCE